MASAPTQPSQSEVERITDALRVLEQAYESVFQAARPGIEAVEIDSIMAAAIEAHGGTFAPGRSTPFVVHEEGTGPKLRLNRVPLETDKLWGMDNTIALRGFHADIGRYGYFGSPASSLLAAHAQVLQRQDVIAAAIKPCVPASDIYNAIPSGLPFEVHRIGQEPHMLPMFGNLSSHLMEAMTESVAKGVCFEPGHVICIELWCGHMGGIEDMYVVVDHGLQRLSGVPREIRILGAEA